jgi:hypothetical protein
MNSKRAVVDWMLADWSTLVSFRGTSSERERERERRRWSGEASSSAERSDANGWMGRGEEPK